VASLTTIINILRSQNHAYDSIFRRVCKEALIVSYSHLPLGCQPITSGKTQTEIVMNRLIVVILSLSMVFPMTGYANTMHSMVHKQLNEDLTEQEGCHIVHHKSKRHHKVKHHKEHNRLVCRKKSPSRKSSGYIGNASWYGPGFHGRRTASGERFNQYAMTAAHKTIPLGTLVMVTNLDTDESVVVKINDRGPFVRGRIIDLSKGAARAIGVNGTTRVKISLLD